MTSRSDYAKFITAKLALCAPSGVSGDVNIMCDMFPHQLALTKWAIKRGRAAIFADTGLGKTRMELAWADVISRHVGLPVLILAPLAVAAQTVAEGRLIGIDVELCRSQADIVSGINITNYDRAHKFEPRSFGGVVLDESSIIKHHDAKTFQRLSDAFRGTLYKLCATATPAPNDWVEFGTHAEFLGVCSRAEMLSEYFTHDGGDTSVWRLKKHAAPIFWEWVASWGALIRHPSDLGYDDSDYRLPPLDIIHHVTDTAQTLGGMLFPIEAQTLSERRSARRISINDRVSACANIVNSEPGPWVVWCDLNAESAALASAIDGSVEISGSDDIDVKESRLHAFASGNYRALVSKPSICGWGLNWQHAAHMAFVGVTDSYEAYYQAIRRCWRFGPKRPVTVHIFSSPAEGAVIANLKAKQSAASQMADSLSAHTRASVTQNVFGSARTTNLYAPSTHMTIPTFLRQT